jgi:hypothetical protein
LEGLDRLSWDQVDQEQVVRRLEHRRIRIVGVADGYDGASGPSRVLLRGVRGLVNEVHLRDLPHKIRRGLPGQIERGFHAGGMSYGYDSVPVGMNSHGEAQGFRLEIVPKQAEVVREIFERYASGESLQRIAADLNERCVPGPGRKRSKLSTWSVSALYGTPKAGSGLLNNELYIGRSVWNRREWLKDPDNPIRKSPADAATGGVEDRRTPRPAHRQRRTMAGGAHEDGITAAAKRPTRTQCADAHIV